MLDVKECSKCGCTDIGVRYHTSADFMNGCSYGSHNKRKTPHLHYNCHVCGWDWTGNTKDHCPDVEDPTPWEFV